MIRKKGKKRINQSLGLTSCAAAAAAAAAAAESYFFEKPLECIRRDRGEFIFL
jgi:homoserine kinase